VRALEGKSQRLSERGREISDQIAALGFKVHAENDAVTRKASAPRREWDIAISDGPAERLREDARIVVQVGQSRPGQIVDLSDMRCGVVEDHHGRTRHVNRRDRRGLAPPIFCRSANRLYAAEGP
jgi:hypothetical protein